MDGEIRRGRCYSFCPTDTFVPFRSADRPLLSLVSRFTFRTDALQTYKLFGSVLSPFDAYLLGRGLKTLAVRMRQTSDTAAQLAVFLSTHPKVSSMV